MSQYVKMEKVVEDEVSVTYLLYWDGKSGAETGRIKILKVDGSYLTLEPVPNKIIARVLFKLRKLGSYPEVTGVASG